MNRRAFARIFASSSFLQKASGQARTSGRARFEADWESIRQHKVPDWYENAKLGIFIHWGLYSVPGWAPTTGELGKVDWNTWFLKNPYAEWYLNTLRLKDSPTYAYHVKTYGANFDYYRFAETFNRETAKWDPSRWAALFRKTSARYVVLTSKHHDGFRLWPSRVANPRRKSEEISSSRDLVGELSAAVRGAGMKMGLYYSGGLDWTFADQPIRVMGDLRKQVPQGEDYARYADAHWTELTDRYKPSLMWNDINYPKKGDLPSLFAHYYNTVPEGVVNNRFGIEFADFTTPEYSKYDKIVEKKWESCRGLGFSFGYNRAEGPEQVIEAGKLIWLLVDIVSKNGNLLLNVGPHPDGTISAIQTDRLEKLGAWLAVNGEGIFDSRPWVRSAAGEVRFTRRGSAVYAFVEKLGTGTVTIPGVIAAEGSKVRMLGSAADSQWQQRGRDLAVSVPAAVNPEFAAAFRITPEPWQVVKS
ncbi:MAG: alpha-L-fucosidase [Bryobacteraceae bacterium]